MLSYLGPALFCLALGPCPDDDDVAPTPRIDPVSAPLTFESPFIHSNIKPTIMRHRFPKSSIFGGGDVRIYAVQVRFAITEQLAFIATKDGYIDFNPSDLDDERGWADIAAGLKYAVIDDRQSGFVLTPGFTYEMTNGSSDVFQGTGEGQWHPFVSGGWAVEGAQLLAAVGYSHPVDPDQTQSIDYHFHASTELADGFFPLVELNGISYTSNGDDLPLDFEAHDYSNLGSQFVEHNDVITAAVGARFRIAPAVFLGAAYEWPLTTREDIFRDRVTVDVVLRF